MDAQFFGLESETREGIGTFYKFNKKGVSPLWLTLCIVIETIVSLESLFK